MSGSLSGENWVHLERISIRESVETDKQQLRIEMGGDENGLEQ